MIINKELAYSIDVPEKVMPSAKIRKVGGMTRKCANLLNLPNGTYRENGVSITVNNQNISFSGVAYSATWVVIGSITLAPGEYTFTGAQGTKPGCDIYLYHASQHTRWGEGTLTVTETKTFHVIIQVTTLTNDTSNFGTINLMLNAGSTALPYEPYFEGLRSAKVTEVKSVGVNVFNIGNRKQGYGSTEGDLVIDGNSNLFYEYPFKPSTQYTLSAYVKNINTTGNVRLAVKYTDGTSDNTVLLNSTTDYQYKEHTTQPNKTIEGIYADHGSTGSMFINGGVLMINEGTEARPYTPYVEHTMPIPEEVRPANGINENVYDFIEWAEDGSVKKTVKCGMVDMPSIPWQLSTTMAMAVIGDMDITPAWDVSKLPSKITSMLYDGTVPIFYLFFDDGAYTSIDELRADLNGVQLVYELAEPIVTDISDLITSDNVVVVQSQGTLIFENENKLAVPIEVEYTRATIENYGRLIVDNLKKIGNYLGVQSDPQSTRNILIGMDSSALKSTNSSNPARSSDILLNKEAYVNGVKVIGSLEFEAEEIVPDGYYDTSDSTISAESILKGYVGYGKSGRMIGTYEPPSYVERDSDDLFDGEENGCIVLNVPYGLYRNGAKWVLPKEVVYTSVAIGEFPIEADFVAEGLVGYVNGERIEGNLPFRQEEDVTVSVLNGNISAKVPRGYYNEDYSVDLKGKYIDTTVLDVGVTSSDIAAGKVAFVNGALITGNAEVRSDSDLTLKIADDNGNVSVEVPNGIYYDHISKTFEDTSTFKLRNTAYKLEGDFASSSKLLRGYVAYANGEMLYGTIDSNGSDAITTDVVNNKVVVNVSGGYYDGDMELELPDTIADVFDASEVDPLEIPKGLVVYGLGKTKLEGLYTKYYADKVTGNADVFKSTDILIRPTLFDDGRYGMALYDGFYSGARAILPSTNWVDTSAGDLYAITENLIPSSYVGYVDGKKIVGSMVYNTSDSISMGIFNNTTLSPTTVTVSVTVDKGFYEIDTPKSLTLRPGIVDSAVLPDGKNYAYNGSLLEGYVAYANGSQIIGNMPFWRYGTGYSVEKNADGKRVNYAVDLGYHQGGSSILDDEILYTGGDNGTLYSHSEEGDDGLWYSDSLAKGVTACANGEVIHGTSTYYYGKTFSIDFTDPVIPDGIYSDSRVYIPGGFVDTSDATISAVRYGDTWISEHVVSGKTVYARGVKVIGTRPSEDTLTWYDGEFGATILDNEATYVIELYDRSDMANNRTMATVYTSLNPTIYDNGIVYLKDPYDPNTLRAFMIVVDRTNNNPMLMLYHVVSAFPDELYEVDVSGYGYRYARISI